MDGQYITLTRMPAGDTGIDLDVINPICAATFEALKNQRRESAPANNTTVFEVEEKPGLKYIVLAMSYKWINQKEAGSMLNNFLRTLTPPLMA